MSQRCMDSGHIAPHSHLQHQMEVSGQLHTTTSLPGERAPSTHYTESCVDHRAGLMQWIAEKSLAFAKNENPDFRLLKLQITKQKSTYTDLTGYQTQNRVIDSQVTTRSPYWILPEISLCLAADIWVLQDPRRCLHNS
jgi:hypothetical protein